MISMIIEAAENFLLNQIELTSKKSNSLNSQSQMRTLIASMDIEMDNGDTKTVYLGFEETLVKEIISVYLMQKNPDAETMQDMVLESTNMIVGSAKVLAEEADTDNFSITTPKFKDMEEFIDCNCNETSVLSTPKDSLVIGIKA